MRIIIKRTVFSIILTALLFLNIRQIHAQTKQYEDLLGMWDLTVLIEGFEEYSTFSFEVKNDTLTGVWNGDFGPLPIRNVSFVQDTLRGVIVIEEADAVQVINIIGAVSKGTMKGRGLSQMNELFPFTAKKQKKEF